MVSQTKTEYLKNDLRKAKLWRTILSKKSLKSGLNPQGKKAPIFYELESKPI